MHLLHIAGARPNFPKLAPVHRAACGAGWQQTIVHTGQHYDAALSDQFFEELSIPHPEENLEVGSASHAVQTARIMERLEPILDARRPDWVLVYGDVNSTVAAALVASKLGIRLAHVEAGLRSYDRTMPEEINRLVTDRLANLLLTPSRDASETLRREGEPEDEIAFVGNVMIDTLLHSLPAARATGFRDRIGAGAESIVVTLHRPSNVDEPARLTRIANALRQLADRHTVLFPVHPRTRQRLRDTGADLGRVQVLEPISYFAMLDLVQGAYAGVAEPTEVRDLGGEPLDDGDGGVFVEVVDDHQLVRRRDPGVERPQHQLDGFALVVDGQDDRELRQHASHRLRIPMLSAAILGE